MEDHCVHSVNTESYSEERGMTNGIRKNFYQGKDRFFKA